MKKRLSAKQQNIIDKLQSGEWQLALDNYGDFMYLQKGKIGYGGESLKVRSKTFYSLVNAGLIKSAGYNFPTEQYILAN